MNLWIRSQDRTKLSKVIDIYVVGYDDDYAIGGYCVNSCDDFDLGVYSSKERALEVLDKIQDFIENRNKVKITQNINGITSEIEDAKRVYEMPLE